MTSKKSVARSLTFDCDDPHQVWAMDALAALPKGARGIFIANLLYDALGTEAPEDLKRKMLEIVHMRFALQPQQALQQSKAHEPRYDVPLVRGINNLKL